MSAMSSLSILMASLVLVTVMAGTEPATVSNSVEVAAYWQTMLPNAPMPLAILELLTPPAGNDDHRKQNNNNIRVVQEGTAEKYFDASLFSVRKIGLHSTKEAITKSEEERQLHSKHQVTETDDKGPSTNTNDQRAVNFQLGPATNDQRTAYFRWGPATNDQKTAYFRWGPATNDQRTAYFRWGPATNDQKTAYFRWGSATNDERTAYFRWGSEIKEEDGHDGDGASHHHMHEEFTMLNNTVFLEEALTPGSTITPYIRPSAVPGGAPLLRRDVADSIPMSTENFTNIMAMFAPASHHMARDIWSTLDICEHLRPVKGEKKTCVTSVESMVEFAASVVARGNTACLHAFSSPDVPVAGVMSGKRYKVVSAKKITEAGDTVTCHNMKFPVAAYMCHAVNPTRVYMVTLESEHIAGVGEVGQRMEGLVVCHLDTSEFGVMTMPENVKPGEAPLCHFISRDSVLWAPAAPTAAA